MSVQRILKDVAAENALGEVLARCPEVTRYDENEHREAWALAHAFSDLEESFCVFLEELLPKLTQGQLDAGETHDVLLDIGEEFRHILYHLKKLKFYSYLHGEEAG